MKDLRDGSNETGSEREEHRSTDPRNIDQYRSNRWRLRKSKIEFIMKMNLFGKD